MNAAVFFDRDGTIAEDAGYCRNPEDFRLFPETAEVFKKLHERGFKVIIITNQSGIGRGYFNEADLERVHDKMKADLAAAETFVDGIYYCPHHPDEDCECRKPKPALILRAARDFDLDLGRSVMVGDLPKDIELGKAAGNRTILVSAQPGPTNADATATNLAEVPDIVAGWQVNES